MSPVSMQDTAVNYDLNFLVPTMWFQGDRASPTTHFLYIFRTQILLQQQNHLQNEKNYTVLTFGSFAANYIQRKCI